MNASPESGRQGIAHQGVVRLSAYQPTSELVAALERAEWHAPDQRWYRAMLNILRGITSLLAEDEATDKAGTASMTETQIAGRAHVSERTVSRWMPVLVQLQLIGWTKGRPAVGVYGAEAGQVRVNKKRVIWLVTRLRPLKDAAKERIREEIATRMRAIKDAHAFWVSRVRGQNRPDTKSGLPPVPGDVPTRGGTPRQPPDDPWATCEHGGMPGRCPSCRRKTNGAGSAGAQTMRGGRS